MSVGEGCIDQGLGAGAVDRREAERGNDESEFGKRRRRANARDSFECGSIRVFGGRKEGRLYEFGDNGVFELSGRRGNA